MSSSRWLEQVFQQCRTGLVVVERDGQIVFANRRAGVLLGAKPDLAGTSLSATAPSMPAVEHLFASHEPFSAVVDELILEGESHPLDGKPERVAITLHDVSEREASRAAQDRHYTFLRQVIDVNPNFIFVKDREGRFTLVNEAVATAYGSTVEELVGKSDADFNSNEEECERFRRDDLDVMESMKEKLIPHEVITDSMGRVRHLQTIKRPLVDPDGVARHMVGVATDITELRLAEEERRELEARVQHGQKLESLGVLAGGIAHDFNNLLVGVMGNADLALMMAPDTPGRECIEQIQIAAQRAGDLCKQLLAYSGKGRFVIEPMDLNEVVREMAHLLEFSISKHAVLRLDLSPETPIVAVDPTQMRQVLMNLITNASDAIGDADGAITIRTSIRDLGSAEVETMTSVNELLPGSYVALEVSDDGCGMSDSVRSRIFDPFFSTKFAGRGLGLAAVLGIVRGHKGTIEVKSEPGATTFQVLLPISSEEPQKPGQVNGDREWRGSGLILVIDDEETVRQVSRNVLELTGFSVITAEDGARGVTAFLERQEEIAAVLLDLTMPGLRGEEVMEKIREARQETPIVLMSGYSEKEAKGRFSGRGLAGFLHKPFRAGDLIDICRQVFTSDNGEDAG